MVLIEVLAGCDEPTSTASEPGSGSMADELVGPTEPARLRRGQCPATVDAVPQLAGRAPAKRIRTTVAGPGADRAPDVQDRQFHTPAAPTLLSVADLNYVPMAREVFGYSAFVVDGFAGRITS